MKNELNELFYNEIEQSVYWACLFLFVLPCYLFYYWLDGRLGYFGSFLSPLVFILFSLFSCSIVMSRLYSVGVDGFFSTIYVLVTGVIYYYAPALVVFAFLVVGLLDDNDKRNHDDRKGNRFIAILIAVYIPVQIWFFAAIVNTYGSDENIINNDRLYVYSILFSSLGLGLFVARIFNIRGAAFFIPLIVGAIAFYYGHAPLVNYIAAKASKERQMAAAIGFLAKNTIAHGVGMPGEDNTFKTPEYIRLQISYLPARIALNPELAGRFLEVIRSSDHLKDIVKEVRQLNSDETYMLAKQEVSMALSKYPEYLRLAALTRKTEESALSFIDEHRKQHNVRILLPKSERLIYRALTCTGIAREIILHVRNIRYGLFKPSVRAKLTDRNGRTQFLSELHAEGVFLPSDWKFTNEKALLSDLSNAICARRDHIINDFEKKYGMPLLNKGRPYTSNEFLNIVANISGVDKLADFTKESYQENFRRLVDQSSSHELIKKLNDNIGKVGPEFIKSAFLPAAGIASSFVFILVNLASLSMLLLRMVGVKSIYSAVAFLSFFVVAVLFLSHHNDGLFAAKISAQEKLISAQEKLYAGANFVFSSVGFYPSLTDQPASYLDRMSEHHVQRSLESIAGNMLMTPSSKSAFFHLTMAKHYNPNLEAGQIAELIYDRYKSIGADDKESPLNYRYIVLARRFGFKHE